MWAFFRQIFGPFSVSCGSAKPERVEITNKTGKSTCRSRFIKEGGAFEASNITGGRACEEQDACRNVVWMSNSIGGDLLFDFSKNRISQLGCHLAFDEARRDCVDRDQTFTQFTC